MTTTVLLVRHATHALVDATLVGRMPHVHLGPAGLEQAKRAARRLRREGLDVVQSSPQPRARETADAIAAACSLTPQVADAFDEIDVGEWTGQSFESLRGRADWRCWNEHRAAARPPGGETMRQVQERAVAHLADLARAASDRRVAIVSHADVIKAALLFYLGAPLDRYDRIDIAPASITTLVLGGWGGKVVRMNEPAGA